MTEDQSQQSFGDKIYVSARQQKQSAMAVALVLVLLSAVVLSMIFSRDIVAVLGHDESRYYIESSEYLSYVNKMVSSIRFSSGLIGLITLGWITYLYMSGVSLIGLRRSAVALDQSVDARTLATMVDSVSEMAKQIRDSSYITDEDRSNIRQELQEIVKNSFSNELLINIDKKYGGVIRNEVVSNFIEEKMDKTQSRLIGFQQSIGRNATGSLVWGLTTAASGIFILSALILWGSPPSQEVPQIVQVFYYTMRVGLVALIELVAFFFLRQYRVMLLDQKYIANEITNAEMRLISAASALKLGNPGAVSKILSDLAKTERNFALKKGETSIFHGGVGADISQSSILADIFSKALSSVKSGK